jgi:hypothetical protein
MLEVHAPHEVVHNLRSFLIQIATICVGLLIAIALEQSVEALHRRHEVAVLRADLHAESRQVLADARRTEAAHIYELHWLAARIAQVQAAVWEHQALGAREPNRMPYYASPDIPIWRSAKAGTRTTLLTKGEVNAYAEVEYVQTHVEAFADARNRAEDAVKSFNREFPALPSGDPDLTTAPSQDLRRYLTLLTAASAAIDRYVVWLRVLTGAELAISDGKTSLEDIYASERKIAETDLRSSM